MTYLKISLLALCIITSNVYAECPPFPIVKNSAHSSRYENVLMTKLRDKTTSTKEFRETASLLGALLVDKVVECFNTSLVTIETPLTEYTGYCLPKQIELVSILRSGDALLESFLNHFPEANVSKILVQRDEETALPKFIYMKLTPSIALGHPVVITEPMLATGGSLSMAISLLKEKGVKEENIIIACICAAPEGLQVLNEKFPLISIVTNAIDEKLNPQKFIVPGLGDFGDRFYGTK